MKKIAKPSTRASIRSASARVLLTSASDHMQDPEQEQDLVEKKAKAAMHKSERKKYMILFLLKKEITNGPDVPDVRQFLNTDLQLQEKLQFVSGNNHLWMNQVSVVPC